MGVLSPAQQRHLADLLIKVLDRMQVHPQPPL